MMELTKPSYTSTAAIAPSSRAENALGYDVELPFLKSLFLQFKRPHILDYRCKPFSFHTDHPGQLETLRKLADKLPRTVFYSLPLIRRDSELEKTLERTLFVQVGCLKANTSRIRVHREFYLGGHWTVDYLKAKVKNGDWYRLTDDCWLDWEQFEHGLKSIDSGIEDWIDQEYAEERKPVGVVLQRDGEPAWYPNAERPVRTVVEEYIAEQDLWFDEEGLTAGMFARS
jgi:hypothetical protein